MCRLSLRATGVVPEVGIKAGRRPPEGRGLDPDEDAAMLDGSGSRSVIMPRAPAQSRLQQRRPPQLRAGAYSTGEIIPIEIPLVRAKPTMSAAVRRRCPRYGLRY